MKKLFLLFTISVIALSCKKENNRPADGNPDSFSFGRYFGFCGPSCAELYNINNETLYGDSVAVSIAVPVIYSSVPMNNADYLTAKALEDNFPAYLENHPNITIGCPDCRDQGTVYIEKVTNGIKQTWIIDTDGTVLPAEIQAYISQLQQVVDDL